MKLNTNSKQGNVDLFSLLSRANLHKQLALWNSLANHCSELLKFDVGVKLVVDCGGAVAVEYIKVRYVFGEEQVASFLQDKAL